jgi:hypothetical protein
MFRESKPPRYCDAFYAAPEVTVIVTPGKNPKSKVGAFRQLLVSKRGGVTDFWFLYGTGRGCRGVVPRQQRRGSR